MLIDELLSQCDATLRTPYRVLVEHVKDPRDGWVWDVEIQAHADSDALRRGDGDTVARSRAPTLSHAVRVASLSLKR